MNELDKKYAKLKESLQHLNKLIVAFSGGVDSALLLKVAYDTIGDKILAITADSPSIPRRELAEAKTIAKDIGASHLVVQTKEMEEDNYIKNSTSRCYYCKFVLYTEILEIANRKKIPFVANGTNIDDLGDYRPGLRAADEFKVVSPLKEAGFTKKDVRDLAKRLGMKIWDKPAAPCLASRIPYGSSVTTDKLAMIETAEKYLKNLNVKVLRVRHFDKRARIEVQTKDFNIINSKMDKIRKEFNAIGFDDIEVSKFASGALNIINQ